MLRDYRTAPIGDAEKALFAFVEHMNGASHTVRREHVEALCAAGWSEEAIYDAITVCALFKFYNTWIDASGVSDMPAAGYEASGERLATAGYAPDDASP